MSQRTWHVRATLVVLGWLAAAALVTLVHRQVPAAGWLMVHLVLLGAVSNALLIWSGHFAQTLLRRPDPPGRRAETVRLALFNAGAVAVVAGVAAGGSAAVAVGAAVAGAAVLAHVVAQVRALRRALPSRFAVTVRYYVAAGLLALPTFALGVALAHGGGPDAAGLLLAHATLGLLGWVGLPILGTLVTLWPTMLRTRIAAGAERHARRAMPWLVVGTLITAGSLVAGHTLAAAGGVAIYLVAAGWTVSPMLVEARQRRPHSFATWSTLAGIAWLGVSLVALGYGLMRSADPAALTASGGALTAAALVGGVLQVLVGSLSYLLPVVVGGGPAAVRIRNARSDRAMAARLLVTNLGLAVCLLPSPSAVRVTASIAVLGALVASATAIGATLRPAASEAVPRGETAPSPGESALHGEAAPRGEGAPRGEAGRPAGERSGVARHGAGITAGLGIVVLAVVVGVAVDPAALGTATQVASAAGDAAPTGHTTRVEVRVEGMRFDPARISVPSGDTLVVELTNTGTDVHDLAIETGQRTPRLRPGESATLDMGVVGRPLAGWCTVAGHRQMGMVLAIEVTGGLAVAAGHDTHATGEAPTPTAGEPAAQEPAAAAASPDLMADPGPGFTPYDARLTPATAEREHRVRLIATEVEADVAPGVRQTRWTFGGTVPGPALRGKVGDTFVVTLVNDGTIGHSIDFHAGALAPDEPMRTIVPGEQLEYRFTATRAGIWMYHCSTMPMSMHIANGMFGAVVIDPPDLPTVDHEFLLVQSEGYLGPQGGTADAEAIAAGDADLVVFNGYPMRYDHDPLAVGVGQRVRIWVLAAGPNRGSSFHVVGGQFDTVYREGAYDLRPGDGGSQALGLFPAQGGFVELALPEPGRYPFVTHAMSDAERGAHGILLATGGS